MGTVFTKGRIYTMNENDDIAEAVYTEQGVIVDVGSAETIEKLYGNKAKVIDLKGKTVLPAFTDTHMHVLSLGMLLKDINQNDCYSIEEIIQKGKAYIKENKVAAGTWVRGRGWNQDNFSDEKRFLNRYDLDKISLEHPIAFTRTCGHVIAVNSKALELMGIHETAPEIEGGEIDLDEEGKPLGIFREMARNCVLNCIPVKTKEEIKELICLAQQEALAHGITEIHTDDFKDTGSDYRRVIQAYKELIEEKKLKIKIYEQCNLPSMPLLQSFMDDGYCTGWQYGNFKIGPFKLISDGSLGARTALLKEPYNDDQSAKGIGLFSVEEIEEMIVYAHKNGFQIAVHAIGDGAVDMVLDAIESAKNKVSREKERHGIIHCQITNSKQLDRMKEMEICAYIQPIFLNYDVHIVNERIGEERAQTAYNWKDFIDRGILTIGGSDCPVESLNIMENIYTAVCRRTLSGYPENGWKPDQNLTVGQAVRLFTVYPAYVSFDEQVKGSVEKGKIADFAVLDADIFQVPQEEIKNIKVLETYAGGECVYRR